MLSTVDLERLIAVKTREIETEKLQLGLSPHTIDVQVHDIEENKENVSGNYQQPKNKQVTFVNSELIEREDAGRTKEERDSSQPQEESGQIPPDLERYIRRYLGLPVMLKAGEFSPNNPLLRGSRVTTDALFSLGEYERQKDTLRKIQQKQYREYLDQQAKRKQDEKERAARERRERADQERRREEQERIREERERDRLRTERERTPDIRQSSIRYYGGITGNFNKRQDTAVQVDSALGQPLSVAVQTDDAELFMLESAQKRSNQAERELSPRLAEPHKHGSHEDKSRQPSRDKLLSDLRHSYMPSIFDAEAIKKRNLMAEKEAAERRLFYQQELKNQILEQQRIREERKNREKLLEQAEMRRLEEQLKMLKLAQEKETNKQRHITTTITESTTDYQRKRKDLQKEIDKERQNLRSLSHPARYVPFRDANTSQSDPSQNISKLPFYYPSILEKHDMKKPPFSSNIPENSLFSPNYDVDAYLRRNLNPSNASLYRFNCFTSNKEFGFDDSENSKADLERIGKTRFRIDEKGDRNIIVEKALIHNVPVEKKRTEDTLPIPVLRHSPRPNQNLNKPENGNLSEAMKVVDDKWKVPVVQKNILKSVSNDEGRNVNILTQLGSIRRQLQLEQLKLDNLVNKDDI